MRILKTMTAVALLSVCTFASTMAEADQRKPHRSWDLTLGPGVASVPEYWGSDENEVVFAPYIWGEYRFNENHSVYLKNLQGVGYTYRHHGGFYAGLKAEYRKGREASDDRDVLTGLGEMDDTGAVGPFMGYRAGNVKIEVDYLVGADSDNDGATSRISAGYISPRQSGVQVYTTIFGLYADEELVSDYFGVTAAEAAASSRTESSSGDGFINYGLMGGISYMMTDKHEIRTDLEINELTGDAGDSSITQDKTQLRGVLAYGYHF